MKKKFTRSVIALTSIMTMAAPSTVFAIAIKGKSGASTKTVNSSSPKDADGTNVTVSTGKSADEKPELKEGEAKYSCDYDANSSKMFPIEFLKEIAKDGKPVEFEVLPNNKISVKFPPILNVCGKFKPQLWQNPKTKDVSIMIVSENKDSTYGKITECLAGEKSPDGKERKKYLDDKNEIDHDKIEGKDYSSYSYELNYDFDKVKDLQKTLKLSVLSPLSLKKDYPSDFDVDDLTTNNLPSSFCSEARNISTKTTYLNKGKDILLKQIVEDCNSKNAQRIAEARRSIGNAEALKDIAEKLKASLDAAYLSAVEEDVKKLYDEMGKIENKIMTGKDLEEKEADKLTKRYAELAKELDEKFLNPAIFRLEALMKRYDQLNDKNDDDKAVREEKESISKQIKALNESIYKFANRLRQDKPQGPSLNALMEKYALVDSAKTIEGIRLKSFLYSKIFPAEKRDDSRGKPISFEVANQKQVKGEQSFDRTLNDWSDVYLVGQGNKAPLVRADAERTQAINKMNQKYATFVQNENKNLAQYCATGMTGAPVNQVQCQTFNQGKEKRFKAYLKTRDKDLDYIKSRSTKVDKMTNSFNSYQKREMERSMRDEDYPYGSTISGYDSTFEENFPQFSSEVSTAPNMMNGYNSQMYSMNGQMTNGYQMNNGMQNGYQMNSGMQNGYQMNSGMQMQNGYQMNSGMQMQNPYQMNNGYQFNNGYQNYNPYQQQYVR